MALLIDRNSCKRVSRFFAFERVKRIFAKWQTKILLFASPAGDSLDSVGDPLFPREVKHLINIGAPMVLHLVVGG